MLQSIAPRCNAERSSAIAQRCFSARVVELIEPVLEPPPQLWDDMSAHFRSHQVCTPRSFIFIIFIYYFSGVGRLRPHSELGPVAQTRLGGERKMRWGNNIDRMSHIKRRPMPSCFEWLAGGYWAIGRKRLWVTTLT